MIKLLSKQVSDKIAAGEVVERPISMVKELVENSIDAGANGIVVEIRNGGKIYLRVTDNGNGIPAEEVSLAFQRHATSKINEAEDLDHIATLGFRGEALSSIAAVSRTELITKYKSEKMGTRLFIEGGTIIEETKTGCPDGTTIIVRDLFYNTPARLKFLKSDATESGLIIEFVSQIALAYPQIRFRMINNQQTLFSTPGNGDRRQVIHTLYGRINSEKLIHIQETIGPYLIEGYISDPGEHRSNRKDQYYYVNGRVIHNKIMERAVDQAYRQRLFDGRHPISYIFLEIPPEEVDVNIHPNKKEVRFHREGEVETFIRDALFNGLQRPEAIPSIYPKELPKKEEAEKVTVESYVHEQVDIKSLLSSLRGGSSTLEEKGFNPESNSYKVRRDEENRNSPVPPEISSTHRFHPEFLTPLGVAFGTYILATDEDNLYLIDQHAAHERILFEKIFAQMENKEKVHQTLLIPFTVTCSVAESLNADNWMSVLHQIGYTLESFGPSTYIVKEIPGFLSFEIAQRFLSDFLDNVLSEDQFSDHNLLIQAASKACKEAVKGNEHLTNEEIQGLLSSLSLCENPMSCPHGRPTFIRLSQGEIERKFRRT